MPLSLQIQPGWLLLFIDRLYFPVMEFYMLKKKLPSNLLSIWELDEKDPMPQHLGPTAK